MQQIKIFKGLENELADLESEVNAWLNDSNARVVHMTGNIAAQTVTPSQRENRIGEGHVPSDVLVVVVYEPGGDA